MRIQERGPATDAKITVRPSGQDYEKIRCAAKSDGWVGDQSFIFCLVCLADDDPGQGQSFRHMVCHMRRPQTSAICSPLITQPLGMACVKVQERQIDRGFLLF